MSQIIIINAITLCVWPLVPLLMLLTTILPIVLQSKANFVTHFVQVFSRKIHYKKSLIIFIFSFTLNIFFSFILKKTFWSFLFLGRRKHPLEARCSPRILIFFCTVLVYTALSQVDFSRKLKKIDQLYVGYNTIKNIKYETNN